VVIKVKSAPEWRDEFGAPLKMLYKENKIQKCFGIYAGKTPLKDGPLDILPIKDFCMKLTQGGVLT
jgi:hypothetical protein